MNKLPLAKRAQVLTLLCEGVSMRSIERIVGCSINTVDKLLQDAGEAALAYHDKAIRGVKATRIQCDEIWSFVGAKQKNVAGSKRAGDPTAGDCWTWTAIEAETKLLISYTVGGRDAEFALMLMDDLRGRLANRVQLTTDGHRASSCTGPRQAARAMSANTAPQNASGRARTRSPATPILGISRRATPSGRTSRCA